MNEFINKLIERLEEEGEKHLELSKACEIGIYEQNRQKAIAGVYGHSISIVNQLAEEYGNDCMLLHTQGLDVGIQCAMCTNPMKSDRGCDGGCSVNKEMYKKVLDVIERHTQIAPYQPKGE